MFDKKPKYEDKALIKAVIGKIKNRISKEKMDKCTDGISRFGNVDGAGKMSRFQAKQEVKKQLMEVINNFLITELGLDNQLSFRDNLRSGMIACKLASKAYEKQLRTIDGKLPAMWASNWSMFNKLLKDVGVDMNCFVESTAFTKEQLPYEVVLNFTRSVEKMKEMGKFNTELDLTPFREYLQVGFSFQIQLPQQENQCSDCEMYRIEIEKLRKSIADSNIKMSDMQERVNQIEKEDLAEKDHIISLESQLKEKYGLVQILNNQIADLEQQNQELAQNSGQSNIEAKTLQQQLKQAQKKEIQQQVQMLSMKTQIEKLEALDVEWKSKLTGLNDLVESQQQQLRDLTHDFYGYKQYAAPLIDDYQHMEEHFNDLELEISGLRRLLDGKTSYDEFEYDIGVCTLLRFIFNMQNLSQTQLRLLKEKQGPVIDALVLMKKWYQLIESEDKKPTDEDRQNAALNIVYLLYSLYGSKAKLPVARQLYVKMKQMDQETMDVLRALENSSQVYKKEFSAEARKQLIQQILYQRKEVVAAEKRARDQDHAIRALQKSVKEKDDEIKRHIAQRRALEQDLKSVKRPVSPRTILVRSQLAGPHVRADPAIEVPTQPTEVVAV